MTDISENLAQVRQLIRQSALEASRAPDEVTLVAVSKTHPAQRIADAFDYGQRDFGENYVQEALAKMEQLQTLPITWHFLGPIQSNKTQAIAKHFAWVHSVDRLKIATRLSDQRPNQLPPLQVCLQVNIDNEANKSGCSVNDAISLASSMAQLPHLQLRGLMAVPAAGSGIEPFLQLAQLLQTINNATQLKLDTLSMGMSADLAHAIAAGATHVRIGTAIFGARH